MTLKYYNNKIRSYIQKFKDKKKLQKYKKNKKQKFNKN